MKKFKSYKTYNQALSQALKLGLSEANIVRDIKGRYFIHIVRNKYYKG